MSAFKTENGWRVVCDDCGLSTITVLQYEECNGPHILHVSEQDWGMTTRTDPSLRQYYCHVCRHHNDPVAHIWFARKWDEVIVEMRIEDKGPVNFVPSQATLKMIAEDKEDVR